MLGLGYYRYVTCNYVSISCTYSTETKRTNLFAYLALQNTIWRWTQKNDCTTELSENRNWLHYISRQLYRPTDLIWTIRERFAVFQSNTQFNPASVGTRKKNASSHPHVAEIYVTRRTDSFCYYDQWERRPYVVEWSPESGVFSLCCRSNLINVQVHRAIIVFIDDL